jgi:hypothetical protein
MLGRAANLRHTAHEPSPSDANVILGGMTLAVPGATGFVALAQRALVKQSRTLRPSPALDATADFVSVFVSFVVVRRGSVTLADGRVEHVADAGDRA